MTLADSEVPNRWLLLALSMLGQGAATVFIVTPAFLIPCLVGERGFSLVLAGFITSAPLVGTMVTLIAWGAVVDRIGERISMTLGLALLTAGSLAAVFTTSFVWLGVVLFFGAMGGASTNAASGRIVIGWFPPERPGTAMGIRPTAQPLGIGVAALLVPNLAEAAGLGATLLAVAALCGVTALLVGLIVIDPPRLSRVESEKLGQFVNPTLATHGCGASTSRRCCW